MKAAILTICLGLCTLVAYPQSKLIGGNKATTVGGSTEKPQTPTSPSKKTTPSKGSVGRTVNPDNKYASTGYMEITGMSFANTDYSGHVIDDYGTDLYASEVRYLKPKLFYKGLASAEKEIDLYVKILKEDGTMESSTGSPEGYSYKNSVNVQSGPGQSVTLVGWGNRYGNAYVAGQYKFQIYYNDNIIYEKGVRLYSGSTPIATSRLIKINRLSFGSEDENSESIIPFGGTLYEGDVKYLTVQISYNGLYSTDQNVTLFYRVFDSNGGLVTGSSSPQGFSSKEAVVIKQGSNFMKLNGWGNASGTLYTSGTGKYELWLDGEKIYETTFEVKKKTDSSVTTTGMTGGHEYVDLGLSVKWATRNIGADKPEDCGSYYAWGEPFPKTIYTHGNSKYYERSVSGLKADKVVDSKGNLLSKHDPASFYWGYSWRTPTLEEMEELDKKCTWTWETRNGRGGFKVTGPNGNSIFLPASGWYNSATTGELEMVDDRSEYWTATVVDDTESARCLFFRKPNTHYASMGHSVQRSRGLCIRPVSK